jgi:hypothetical protein
MILRSLSSLKTRIAFALCALYLVWGSTYLAIRIALETMPPFLMMSAQFLIAIASPLQQARGQFREQLARLRQFGEAVAERGEIARRHRPRLRAHVNALEVGRVFEERAKLLAHHAAAPRHGTHG